MSSEYTKREMSLPQLHRLLWWHRRWEQEGGSEETRLSSLCGMVRKEEEWGLGDGPVSPFDVITKQVNKEINASKQSVHL